MESAAAHRPDEIGAMQRQHDLQHRMLHVIVLNI
jgi:hypothetical protein